MTGEVQQLDLRKILTAMSVGQLELKSRPTLAPSDSVAAAAARMRDQNCGSVVVYEGSGLAGIFTERDLLKLIGSGADLNQPLSGVMTKKPQTVCTTESVYDAMRRMNKGGYRRLPVVDPKGATVGIVDVKTIVHLLVEQFPKGVYTQAPHDSIIAKKPEGA